jgi:hypothetical protein
VLLAALALYALLVFYGIGVPAEGVARHWYEPRSFLFDVPGLAGVLAGIGPALAWVGAPAAVLAAGVLLFGRSALAGALAVSLALACLLFAFYGIQAPRVWEFFGWRGSVVLWLVALVVGASLTAPLLAASWLRQRWPLRLALYLPPAFAGVAFVRNATGTDPALRYSISPWPAVPVFGIELGAILVFSWLCGAAIAVAALERRRATASRVAHALGIGVGLATPVLLLGAGSALGLLPFTADRRVFVPTVAACALTVGAVATLRAQGVGVLGRRARRLAVGAALIGIPLIAGQALARWDYYRTREHDARSIIDALAAYYEREQLYPDALQDLVRSGDLRRVPTPSIGFSFLYDGDFRYESFGTSFILEFPAPRWVECAYTPPYLDEAEDGEGEPLPSEAAAAGDEGSESWETDPIGAGEALDEAWSCPSAPPELW